MKQYLQALRPRKSYDTDSTPNHNTYQGFAWTRSWLKSNDSTRRKSRHYWGGGNGNLVSLPFWSIQKHILTIWLTRELLIKQITNRSIFPNRFRIACNLKPLTTTSLRTPMTSTMLPSIVWLMNFILIVSVLLAVSLSPLYQVVRNSKFNSSEN